jgi:hypothetical protein
LWIPGQAQHVYFINYPNLLLTYQQNEKIMRAFAVLILVSSLTYSVVTIKPDPNAFRVGSKYQNISMLLLSTLPFCIPYGEQNGLQSLRKN